MTCRITRSCKTWSAPATRMERSPAAPAAPICGEECETIYKDRYGAYVGCDVCMETKDAWEVEDCFPERSEDA